jgi:subtilase family serine protease
MISRFKQASAWATLLSGLLLTGCGAGGGAASALNEVVSDVVSAALDLPAVTDIAALPVIPLISSRSGAVNSFINPTEPHTTTPLATNVTTLANAVQAVKIYTPAQIRAAYQLPLLPSAASWGTLTADQRAGLGAGQTIYIIAAYHNPNVASELQAFNSQFGLPTCSSLSIAPTQALPLSAAATSGCQLSVVYSSGTGMSSTAPAYDSNWAMEIALDVQWAHATAPLARLVLIEAADANTPSMLNAINLANAMGPGVVSMSFGTNEGSWVNSMDSAFSSANMSYLAASGDSGTGVGAQWPSVSSRVLAVGGTSLGSYTASARAETVWSSTGGNRSQYVALPSYQNASVPGMVSPSMRSVADVAFNADPTTGQYVAIMPQGQRSVTWYSMGGTSLGTPQWAGIVAVINAKRALNAQAALGVVQNLIYPASSLPGFYTTQFADILSGASGSISASTGYDIPSGLGSPNVLSLLTLATSGSGGSTTVGATPPVVASNLTINGMAGSPLSFSVSYTASNPVAWSLSGAPSGMNIDPVAGLISWPSPVAGTYAVTATATDKVTNLSGQATIAINIAPASAPVVKNATIQGNAGVALTYRVPVASRNPVRFALGGSVPTGLSLSSNGVLSWPSPVAGNYAFNVIVTDSTTNVSATAAITLQIGAALTFNGPTISVLPINGTAGTPLAAVIGVTDTDPGVRSVSVSIKGAPAGMNFGGSAQGIIVRWARPVAGTYTLVVTATDNLNHSNQASLVVTIN